MRETKAKPNRDQGNPRKGAISWIFLDFFDRFETFQWDTAIPRKIFFVSPIGAIISIIQNYQGVTFPCRDDPREAFGVRPSLMAILSSARPFGASGRNPPAPQLPDAVQPARVGFSGTEAYDQTRFLSRTNKEHQRSNCAQDEAANGDSGPTARVCRRRSFCCARAYRLLCEPSQ